MEHGLSVIESEALRALSSFDGENYEGENDNYDGMGDEMVSFDEYEDSFNGLAQSFALELKSSKAFIMTIDNTQGLPAPAGSPVGTAPSQQPATFYLNRGYKAILEVQTNQGKGILFEGSCTSIEGIPLRVTGRPSSFSELLVWSTLNPTRILGFKVASADSNNLESVLEVEPLSPFKKLGSRNIYIGAHRDEHTFKDNVVTVKEGFDFNNQVSIKGGITPNSTLTFTFVFGAVLNTAVALKKKRSRAKHNAVKKGKPTNGFAD
jgi:hypothetical protein